MSDIIDSIRVPCERSVRAVTTLVRGLKFINNGIVLNVRNNTRCNDLFNNFIDKKDKFDTGR